MNPVYGLLIAASPAALFLFWEGFIRAQRTTPEPVKWRLSMAISGVLALTSAGMAAGRLWAGGEDALFRAIFLALPALWCGFNFFRTLRAGPTAPSGAETHA